MGESSQVDRAKMRRAIEREIDDIVWGKIKSDADFERAEVEKARRRAGLPKLPNANIVQIQMQRLFGLLNFRERAHVVDLLRESVCHELLRKATWAEKTGPQDEELQVRVQTLSDITVEVENRVLHRHKSDSVEKAKWLDAKQEKIYQKATVARGVVDRLERTIEAHEKVVQEIAGSRGWMADEDKDVVFATEVFKALECRVLELEKHSLESEKLLTSLPVVDLQSLAPADLQELSEAVTAANQYLAFAVGEIAGALNNIEAASTEASEQIKIWQERLESAQEKEQSDKEVSLCQGYLKGYQRYMAHHNVAADQVRKYLHDMQAKASRMQDARKHVHKLLAQP